MSDPNHFAAAADGNDDGFSSIHSSMSSLFSIDSADMEAKDLEMRQLETEETQQENPEVPLTPDTLQRRADALLAPATATTLQPETILERFRRSLRGRPSSRSASASFRSSGSRIASGRRASSPITTPQMSVRCNRQVRATTETQQVRDTVYINITNMTGPVHLPAGTEVITSNQQQVEGGEQASSPSTPSTIEALAREVATLLHEDELRVLGAFHQAQANLSTRLPLPSPAASAEPPSIQVQGTNRQVILPTVSSRVEPGTVFEENVVSCQSRVDQNGNIQITWQSVRTKAVSQLKQTPKPLSKFLLAGIVLVAGLMATLLVLKKMGLLPSPGGSSIEGVLGGHNE